MSQEFPGALEMVGHKVCCASETSVLGGLGRDVWRTCFHTYIFIYIRSTYGYIYIHVYIHICVLMHAYMRHVHIYI